MESKVEFPATTSKLKTTSNVSNGSSTPTSTSSLARSMMVPSPPLISRYVHPPNTCTWGIGWGNTREPPKGKNTSQEK